MKITEMIELFKERIEELKADIREFTIMEVDAVTERDKVRYGIKLAQTKDTLQETRVALELAEQKLKLQQELESEISELFNVSLSDIDIEDIEELLKTIFRSGSND